MYIVRALRALADELFANTSTHQLALGAALGMTIGLVPKGNLIAVALLIILFSLRVNRGMGLVTAFAFTWIGAALDPISHHLGLTVLKSKMLEPVFIWMLDRPVLPWTSFNNTVVMGSALIAVFGFVPVYFACRFFINRYGEDLLARMANSKVHHLLPGAKLANQGQNQ